MNKKIKHSTPNITQADYAKKYPCIHCNGKSRKYPMWSKINKKTGETYYECVECVMKHRK